jgi:hypothetical protein
MRCSIGSRADPPARQARGATMARWGLRSPETVPPASEAHMADILPEAMQWLDLFFFRSKSGSPRQSAHDPDHLFRGTNNILKFQQDYGFLSQKPSPPEHYIDSMLVVGPAGKG